MGSVTVNADSGSDKTVTVLITGFQPFKREYPINPSWEIARSLPAWLPPLRAKQQPSHPHAPPSTTTTSPDVHSQTPIPPVRILTHPTPIRVNYTTVRTLIPDLWDLDGTVHPDRPKIDFVIHIGMAGPRLFYSIERRGHRDGYVMPDVDGQVPRGGTWLGHNREGGREDGDGVEKREEGEGEEEEVPGELETGFDVRDVLERWRGYSPSHMDLRISEDAGHYLCDFIYFSSLAHLHKAGEKKRVLFLHVPSDASEHSIALGRELVLQLVRAVVESEVVRREKEKVEGASDGPAGATR